MKKVKHSVIAEVRRTGRISNEFLDSLNIATTEGAVNRDDLTLCRQDAQLITHVDTVARYVEYKEKREVLADPVQVTLAAEMKKATTLLAREDKRVAGVEKRKALKDANALRRSELSPSELEEEDRRIKISKHEEKQRKDQKEDEKKQKLLDAAELIKTKGKVQKKEGVVVI